jgi:hypothetical protein
VKTGIERGKMGEKIFYDKSLTRWIELKLIYIGLERVSIATAKNDDYTAKNHGKMAAWKRTRDEIDAYNKSRINDFWVLEPYTLVAV